MFNMARKKIEDRPVFIGLKREWSVAKNRGYAKKMSKEIYRTCSMLLS